MARMFLVAFLLCCVLLQALSGALGAHPWHLSELDEAANSTHLHLVLSTETVTTDSPVSELAELCLDCHCHSGQATLPVGSAMSVLSRQYKRYHRLLWYFPLLVALQFRPPISFS
ncbi:hypothetical protein Q3O60_04090 [Alkalimonas collagenimarina]|uniref:DUF2946 domain-containing protein n=1 Tax=Alkalimonas collagenimarina TaxID=400390 RepID=A0ABT9GWD2_9GAMM|nr:hypothetical protein [Alkalimonas collagenimarina]MDP4535367.1 hypothetical protein [Alkalimonas collagenimarina]